MWITTKAEEQWIGLKHIRLEHSFYWGDAAKYHWGSLHVISSPQERCFDLMQGSKKFRPIKDSSAGLWTFEECYVFMYEVHRVEFLRHGKCVV